VTKIKTSYVRKGVRYGRYRTFGSRWGEGKVHLFIYRKAEKEWVTSCRFNDLGTFSGMYGEVIDADTPVTCKKCAKHSEGSS